MGSKKVTIFLIILLVLFGIAFAVVWWMKQNTVRIPLGQENTDTVQKIEFPEVQKPEVSVIVPPQQVQEEIRVDAPSVPIVSPEIVARKFVEAFGTWSNNNLDEHIENIQSRSTSEFFQELKTALYALKLQYPAEKGFYGITTRVVNVNIESYQETLGFARALLKTQRDIESAQSGKVEQTVEYKDIYLELKRVDNRWLVSGMNWVKTE